MRRGRPYPPGSIFGSFRCCRGPALATLGLIALSGCGGGSSHGVIRLVDRFEEDAVRNAPTKIAPSESAGSWNFSEPADSPAMLGWKSGVGVSGLRVDDGRLLGRSTTDFPIIWVDNKDGVDSPDLLHAVEVRLRVGKGSNLMATAQGPTTSISSRSSSGPNPCNSPGISQRPWRPATRCKPSRCASPARRRYRDSTSCSSARPTWRAPTSKLNPCA